jgi:hypothetical protein
MSNAHNCDLSQPLVETHTRNKTASVFFAPPVVELFPNFEARQELVAALGDEINQIPAEVIPYGTLFFNDLLFVYRAAWDNEEEIWFMDIDLATHSVEIGYVVEVDGDDENDDLPTVH